MVTAETVSFAVRAKNMPSLITVYGFRLLELRFPRSKIGQENLAIGGGCLSEFMAKIEPMPT